MMPIWRLRPQASRSLSLWTCKDTGVSLTWVVPGMLGLGLEGWDDVAELFQTVQSSPKARLKL
ncbi:hypothetical protein P692DRAFT_20824366, partial [Suillus brevipes Sb2]